MTDGDLDVARGLAAAGIPVFVAYPDPDKPGEYKPPKGWQATTANPAYVSAWQPGRALCAVMGHGIDLVDVDPRNGGDPATLNGILPDVIGMAQSPSGGYHLFVRSMGVRSRDGVLPGIDVKAGDPDGTGRGFAFIAPTVRKSKVTGEGGTYTWGKPPDLNRLNGATGADSKLAQLVRQAHGSRKAPDGFAQPDPAERKHTGPIPYGEHHSQLVSYAGWLRSRAIPLRPEAETLMLRRLRDVVQPPGATRPVYTDEEVLAELHDVYERYGAGDLAAEQAHAPAEPGKLPRTQDDWGRRFAAQITSMRHVHGIGWHVWDGRRWREDDTALATMAMSDLILSGYAELATIAAAEAKNALKDLTMMRRAQAISGALTLAAARPGTAVAVRETDAHPNLLNAANGTLNLTTMTLHDHDPKQLLTKVCRGAYRPGGGETRWSKFTAEILPDPEVRTFVQRLLGVAIYGAVIEHVLAVLWGRGRNGKSTFIEAVMHALGDYALQADAKLLLSGASDRHSTERADLQGRRLAICMETAKGRQVDAAMAKQLTGGDTITARRMRKDNISFAPSHTVMLVSNYKPVVAGDDDALWKRIRLVPFTQQFLGNNADKGLPDLLKSDPDAVITWMAEGWKDYQRNGLNEPSAVLAATSSYREESDLVGQFLGECCHVAETAYALGQPGAKSSVLYHAWAAWCKHRGEDAGSQKELTTTLTERGLVNRRSSDGVRWLGVTLLDETPGGEGS